VKRMRWIVLSGVGVVTLGCGWVLLFGGFHWFTIEETPAQTYYLRLIAGIASSLHDEVVITGLFVVLMTHAGDSILGIHPRRRGNFLKISILLSFVILFASYYAITYSLDLQQALSSAPLSHQAIVDHPRVSRLPILMVPLDLLAVGLSIAIMVCLASERVLAALVGRTKEIETRPILEKVTILLWLTAGWHAVTVLWWLVFAGYGGSSVTAAANDMAFHGLFAGLHVCGALGFGAIADAERPGWLEWAGVAYYCGLLGVVYVLRMHMYIQFR